MKMPTLLNAVDLDQWLYKSSNKKVQEDPLAAFKKMTISEHSEPKSLIRLPSILTSDNAATWLVTRKNKNEKVQNEVKMAQKMENDNDKWLIKPKNETVKVETDVVTLTGRLTKLRFT